MPPRKIFPSIHFEELLPGCASARPMPPLAPREDPGSSPKKSAEEPGAPCKALLPEDAEGPTAPEEEDRDMPKTLYPGDTIQGSPSPDLLPPPLLLLLLLLLLEPPPIVSPLLL